MQEHIIRYPNGKIIGRIRELPDRIEARTSGGVLLGWYCKVSDRTRYASGELAALGNAVRVHLVMFNLPFIKSVRSENGLIKL